MWEIALTGRFGIFPDLHDVVLDLPERFLFRNAGIRYAVQAFLQQFPLFLGRKVAPVRDPLVVRVRHQVHDILFQVGTRAGDDVYLTCADDLRQGNTQFSGTHGTSEGDHHLATFSQVCLITFCCIHHRSRVEVTIVVHYKLGNRTFCHNLDLDRQN